MGHPWEVFFLGACQMCCFVHVKHDACQFAMTVGYMNVNTSANRYLLFFVKPFNLFLKTHCCILAGYTCYSLKTVHTSVQEVEIITKYIIGNTTLVTPTL